MKLPPKIYSPRRSNSRKACFKRWCYRHAYKLAWTGNFLLISLSGGFLCWWALNYTQLHVCLTPSLENTRILLFYKSPLYEIKRGDIVAIQGHTYRYLGQKYYAKRVIGFPGEAVIREENSLKIAAKRLPLMDQTVKGQPLTPISVTVIPENYFFVAGDHPRSIDSRYEEFGLVPQNKIFGKALLAW